MNIIALLCGLVAVIIIVVAFIYDITEPGWPSPSEIYSRRPVSPPLSSGHNDNRILQNGDDDSANTPDGEYDKIFWFLQISDLHFSIFKDLSRGPDLIQFCHSQVSVLRPRFVLLSGDIVDAKTRNTFGSQQYLAEWKMYEQVTDECTRQVDGQWFDTRGNHDAFDVPHFNSSKNFFRRYSIQRQFSNQTSYMFDFNTDYGRYSFIAIDACLAPGPKRPFNFFGQLKDSDVRRLIDYSQRSRDSNMTIWFGHYPTSFIIYPDLRSVLSSGIAYLCGHLHTLGGQVPNMYTRQKTGMLELELGDWKDNRMFRLLAVDHDLLSFTDEVINKWPVVLITNPKHALFLAPKHEPLYRIATSTHIRILVFSPGLIKYVNVSINNQLLGSATHVKNSLYVLPWTPTLYLTGLHKIVVTVQDSYGNERTVDQPFSIDNSHPNFAIVPKLFLMMNFVDIGKILFWIIFSFWLIALVLLRRCSRIRCYLFVSNTPIINTICSWCNCWIQVLWKLTQVDQLFYISLVMFVYIGVGPWFIGEFLENEKGVMFVWGIFVLNTLIPGSFTYFFGIFQLVSFNIPLTFYLGYFFDRVSYKFQVWNRTSQRQQQSKYFLPIWWLILMEIPLVLIFLLQFYLALSGFPKAYGLIAFYMCPVRTWSSILMILLNVLAYRLACSDPPLMRRSPSP